MYGANGQYDEALSWFELSLSIEPAPQDKHAELALLAHNNGKVDAWVLFSSNVIVMPC